MTPDTSPAVWTYWENLPGTSRSAYLDLCLETMGRHSAPLELRVLDRDTAPHWLPDLDMERWEGLPAPNYRSDYVRSRLLQRHGGIWIDLDTVALSPLPEMMSEIDNTGIVCWGKELGRFFGNMCAASPGSAFVDAWVEGQDSALSRRSDWSTMAYSALAQDVCWPIARQVPWKSIPMQRIAPVPWYQWRRFLSRVDAPGPILAAQPITVVLWNAVMAPILRPLARQQVLASHMLLSRLLRIGLGTSSPHDEEDVWTRLHALSDLRFTLTGQRVESTARRALDRRRRS